MIYISSIIQVIYVQNSGRGNKECERNASWNNDDIEIQEY